MPTRKFHKPERQSTNILPSTTSKSLTHRLADKPAIRFALTCRITQAIQINTFVYSELIVYFSHRATCIKWGNWFVNLAAGEIFLITIINQANIYDDNGALLSLY